MYPSFTADHEYKFIFSQQQISMVKRYLNRWDFNMIDIRFCQIKASS